MVTVGGLSQHGSLFNGGKFKGGQWLLMGNTGGGGAGYYGGGGGGIIQTILDKRSGGGGSSFYGHPQATCGATEDGGRCRWWWSIRST